MKKQNTTITVLSLPEEIIRGEILPRFPVKSLLRFRCVSKPWRSLIDSVGFIKTQHEICKRDPSFLKQSVILRNIGHLPEQWSVQSLLSEEKEPINPSPLHVTSNNNSLMRFQVVGCYNGLVCIRMSPAEFYLWNPSTRISKKLPKIVSNERFYVEFCGFGWDESSGEYKVSALLRDRNSFTHRANVYSSKTKSWKTIEFNFTRSCYCAGMEGVFVGGKLHWRGFSQNHDDILFLDLKSEVFGRIELPFDKGNGYSPCGQIGGCLCVLHHNTGRNIRVWVMKESWERLVSLSLDHELLQRPFSASSFIHKGSNGEIFVFHGSTFLVYDPRSNEFRFPKVCSRYDWHNVYVESLVSPEDV